MRHRLPLILAGVSLIPSISRSATPDVAYRFKPGEELVYELISQTDLLEEPEASDRRYETKARWNVYPVRKNEDGSWRLVIRTSVKLLRYDREEAQAGELGDWKKEPHVRLENTFLGYCDLSPDGDYKANSTHGQSYLFELVPEMIFIPLPRTDLDGDPTTRTALSSGGAYSLVAESEGGDRVRLTGSLKRPLSDNYGQTTKLDIDFDAASGRVREIVETRKSVWRDRPSHKRDTYRLTQIERRTPAWMAEFERAALTYFQHRDSWWDHKLEAIKSRTENDCRQLVESARERLIAARESVNFAEVRTAFDGLVALHDREAEWDITGAAEREELYSKPPVDWATTNLDGEPRSRRDYQGKVVLLDSWYRGCGHCILALPKVKALHTKYKDRGVVVLGVNSDRYLDDARHVVRTYSMPYESVRNVMLRAPGKGADLENGGEVAQEARISSEYLVDSWPTFVVLDQTGRIAEVVSGNAEDLVEHLSRVIDELLGSADGESPGL